jgi:hypothetical protein
VTVRAFRHHAASRRSLEEAELHQVRLHDLLDRVLLLADRSGKRRQANRAAAELVDHDVQDRVVEVVESSIVDLEQLEAAVSGGLFTPDTSPDLILAALRPNSPLDGAGRSTDLSGPSLGV